MLLSTLPPCPSAKHKSASQPVMQVPLWALDGRPLRWNQSRTAFMVECTAEEYLSDRNAVSSTMLKAAARSPRHAMNPSKGDTRSRRLGTAVHARVLEPELFKKSYVSCPHKLNSKLGKEFVAIHSGKTILRDDEMDLVERVSQRALSETILQQGESTFTLEEIVQLGSAEVTIYWIDADTGLTCKARLDLIAGFLTIDLKTTDDARLQAFSSQADRLGYDIQAAHYLRARRAFEPTLPITPFAFLAVELLPFGDVQVHQADPDEFVAIGEESVKATMRRIAESRRTGVATGYETRGGLLKLPMYKRMPIIELN